MAVDPVQYIDKGKGYFQRYTYADNNPYKYTDPTGEYFQFFKTITTISVAIGAALNLDDFEEKIDAQAKVSMEDAQEVADRVESSFKQLEDGRFSTRAFKEYSQVNKKSVRAAMDSTLSGGNVPHSMSGGMLSNNPLDAAINKAIELETNMALEEQHRRRSVNASEQSPDRMSSNDKKDSFNDKSDKSEE